MNVVVTGNRPNKLGFLGWSGYDAENPLRVAIRAEMHRHLVSLCALKAWSGMALGIDQDFARVCIELGILFTAAIPFDGQESQWPEESQTLYRSLIAQAGEIVYVCPPGYAHWKMQARNVWQVDEVGPDGVVLAVWDGSPGGTANCVKYAKSRNRRIITIDPTSVAAEL